MNNIQKETVSWISTFRIIGNKSFSISLTFYSVNLRGEVQRFPPLANIITNGGKALHMPSQIDRIKGYASL